MLNKIETDKQLMEFGEYCATRAIKKFCGEVDLKQRMNTFEVAERLGVKPETVISRHIKWKLKLIGKGPNGLNIFCGASVQQYIEKLKRS